MDIHVSGPAGAGIDAAAPEVHAQLLFSFVVGFVFGKLMDLEKPFIDALPLNIPMRVLYFVLSYLILCFGILAGNRCGLPITPTDLFPREMADITKLPYARVKITFDLTCLITHRCHHFCGRRCHPRSGHRHCGRRLHHGQGHRLYRQPAG